MTSPRLSRSPHRVSSLESLSTSSSYASLPATANVSTRSSTLEPMKSHSSKTPLQKKARFADDPCTGTYYTHGEKALRKPSKNLTKKILHGAGNALGFCCWLLCASCVLSAPEELKWNEKSH